MQPARIAELLAPFVGPADAGRLTAAVLEYISTYIDILLRWNARINLTAIREPEQIVTRHFGESIFAARHLVSRTNHVGTAALGCPAEHSSAEQEPGVAVADIGSGAGFPGIPLKLWAPHINLTLIESNHKKATFLREAARALTLTDINIISARAETLPRSSFNLVTLRAVERFETILPVASGLVASGGRLALLIGQSQAQLAESALQDLRWEVPLAIPESNARVLLVGSN